MLYISILKILEFGGASFSCYLSRRCSMHKQEYLTAGKGVSKMVMKQKTATLCWLPPTLATIVYHESSLATPCMIILQPCIHERNCCSYTGLEDWFGTFGLRVSISPRMHPADHISTASRPMFDDMKRMSVTYVGWKRNQCHTSFIDIVSSSHRRSWQKINHQHCQKRKIQQCPNNTASRPWHKCILKLLGPPDQVAMIGWGTFLSLKLCLRCPVIPGHHVLRQHQFIVPILEWSTRNDRKPFEHKMHQNALKFGWQSLTVANLLQNQNISKLFKKLQYIIRVVLQTCQGLGLPNANSLTKI